MGGGGFASGERLNLKNQKTEKNDPYQNQSNLHQNFYSEFLRKILNRLNCKRYFFQNSKGTILIEFAFCVPVLILLLLYINDIMILARTQDEMKRAAYCAVQLIQNVSKNRTNKKITQQDLKNIKKAINIVLPFSHKISNFTCCISPSIILVEGTGNNNCIIKWINLIDHAPLKGNDNIPRWGPITISTFHGKSGRLSDERSVTSLYKDLRVQEGKIKTIVELCLLNQNKDDGKSIEKVLGLSVLKKPAGYIIANGEFVCFMTHVIFTPVDGIFDADNPPK